MEELSFMKRIYEFKDQYDAKFLQIYSGNQKCNSFPSNIEWWGV